jgi:hypothetical protein
MQHKINGIFLSLLWVTSMAIQIAAAETTEITRKNRDIVIDGNFTDWKDIPTQFDENLNLVSGIINDDSCLYVMLRFQDAHLARKMNMCGSTLWLNSNNKKEKKLGIRYFNENLPAEPDREKPPAEMSEIKSRELEPVRGNIEMNGSFSVREDDFTSLISETQFKGAAAFQTGFYCFEYQIPLTEIKSKAAGLKIKPGEKFKIGLEIEAVSSEMRAKMEERMKDRKPPEGDRPGGGPMGGMGGNPPGGGQMGGGPRGGGSMGGSQMRGDRPQMEKNEEIWLTLKLAVPPAKSK